MRAIKGVSPRQSMTIHNIWVEFVGQSGDRSREFFLYRSHGGNPLVSRSDAPRTLYAGASYATVVLKARPNT